MEYSRLVLLALPICGVQRDFRGVYSITQKWLGTSLKIYHSRLSQFSHGVCPQELWPPVTQGPRNQIYQCWDSSSSDEERRRRPQWTLSVNPIEASHRIERMSNSTLLYTRRPVLGMHVTYSPRYVSVTSVETTWETEGSKHTFLRPR